MDAWRVADPGAFETYCETLDLGVDLGETPDEVVTLGSRPPALEPLVIAPDPAPSPAGERRLVGPVAGFDFEVGALLGQGGMARVHLGWQRSVGREVAIKIPRAGGGHDARVAALVREARITGRLEHPNVPPMHGLGRTGEGITVMTMKRIEGVSWRAALDDDAVLPPRFRSGDRLESHLRVLMGVCDAVHFGHSRGVLHRDIKPSNVLLGAYGEVYLADWGIAVVLDDTPDLPRAVDVCEPAGTPGYMAPEMAAGDGSALGVCSDVYGLGAVLHRVLTGAPRHGGASYIEALARAFESAPVEYPPSVPRRLAAICARATARDPALRFEDAAAFRRAIAEFLEQRDSSRLVDEAEAAGAHLDAARAGGDGAAIERHFGVARFALEHALRVWPGNHDARDALHTLLLDQAGYALTARRTSYADGLLAAIEGGTAAVVERRRALLERVGHLRERQRRLGRLAREIDLGVFSRHRGLVAIGLGLAWGLNGLRRADVRPTVEQLLGDQLWMAGALVALLVVLRRWLWSTRVNRRVSLALMGIVALDTCVRLAGWQLGLAAPQIAAMELAADTGGILLLALLVDLRLLIAAALMGLGAAWGLSQPDEIFRITAWTVLVTLASMGVVWLIWPASVRLDRR